MIIHNEYECVCMVAETTTHQPPMALLPDTLTLTYRTTLAYLWVDRDSRHILRVCLLASVCVFSVFLCEC